MNAATCLLLACLRLLTILTTYKGRAAVMRDRLLSASWAVRCVSNELPDEQGPILCVIAGPGRGALLLRKVPLVGWWPHIALRCC